MKSIMFKNKELELEKKKERSRLSMKMLRAERSGKNHKIIEQLLNEREKLKENKEKYKTRYKKQPKIITDVSEFKTLRLESSIIVDKSLLIKDVLESPSTVSLVTRPRRWGKSLNLSMLKTFFEIEVDEKGKPLPLSKRTNPKLFSDLKISLEYEVMKHLGKYPVIYLSLRETKGTSYKEVKQKIIKRIVNSFHEHIYLINSNELEKNEKEIFQRYLIGEISKVDLEESLYFLSRLLYKHFSQKVYIFIDEYDVTINSTYVRFGHKSKEFIQLIDLIRGMLGLVLKENSQYLKGGLVSGILRIAKADLFTGLNNISEYSLLDKRFSESYGFNQEEVDELLNKLPNVVDHNDLKNWYNGYNFGERTVYNPFSVMKCLSEGKFDTYWLDSGNTELIDQVMFSDDNQTELQDLFYDNKSVTKRIYKQIAFEEIKEQKNSFYSLLLFTGYLNPTPIEIDVYKLSIPPNREIRYIFENRIMRWVEKKMSISSEKIKDLINLLLKNEIDKFTEWLSQCFLRYTSSHDRKREDNCHMWMGGLFIFLSNKYHIRSNRESGYGRYDHALVPKLNNSSDTALLLEYKKCKKDSELEKLVEIVLNQIDEKRYDTEIIEDERIKKIQKVCLVFGNGKIVGKSKVEEIRR